MLILQGDAEVREDQDEDKDVVNGERLLDHVAGEELKCQALPDVAAKAASRIKVEAVVEDLGEGDPDDGPAERLTEGHDMGVPVEHTQIEGEQKQDEYGERGVQPPELSEGKCKIHVWVTFLRRTA
jgi:hypothetical protein